MVVIMQFFEENLEVKVVSIKILTEGEAGGFFL
jgi:hypothetical protein